MSSAVQLALRGEGTESDGALGLDPLETRESGQAGTRGDPGFGFFLSRRRFLPPCSLCRGAEFLSCWTACLFLLLRSEVLMVQITGVWLGHHSDPESSETLLIFFWLGFGTEIPYRFLDSCGHGCGLCSRQSAVVLPHFQSIFPWISRSRRANHRFLILFFFVPSLFFRAFFCMSGVWC